MASDTEVKKSAAKFTRIVMRQDDTLLMGDQRLHVMAGHQYTLPTEFVESALEPQGKCTVLERGISAPKAERPRAEQADQSAGG